MLNMKGRLCHDHHELRASRNLDALFSMYIMRNNLEFLTPKPHKIFYHGTSSANDIQNKLLPPERSNVISEMGRKKNLDRVFFTEDIGLAKIYAGRASKSIGGEPIIYRVVMPIDPICMNDDSGASVWHCSEAFCELLH